MGWLNKWLHPLKVESDLSNVIIVVSGLPRSGTSMMMRMLEAGGIPLLTDHQRAADEDNPKGYYEFERVKRLPKGDIGWLSEARGRAVKIISALLEHLPPEYEYRVIFMQRDLNEVLASQRKMLLRRGENPNKIEDRELYRLFEKHLHQIRQWLAKQPNIRVLDVPYNAMIQDPIPFIHQINAFLGGRLKEQAMARVVDPALYRNRIGAISR